MSTPPVGIEPTALQRTTVFKTALHANWRSTAYPTVSGLEPLQRFHAYLRFSKPLPYQLGLHRHSKPTKWVRQGFGTNPDQRQRKDSNLHRVLPLHSPSKQASYQLEYAATPNPQSGCDKDFVRNPDQYLRQDSNLQSTD